MLRSRSRGEAVSGLRSLADGFVPPILDLDVLDSRMLVDSEAAFATTRELLEHEGIFAGVSSGAIIHVARRWAGRLDEGSVVALLPDGGWKYLSTGLWTSDYAEIESRIRGKLWW